MNIFHQRVKYLGYSPTSQKLSATSSAKVSANKCQEIIWEMSVSVSGGALETLRGNTRGHLSKRHNDMNAY